MNEMSPSPASVPRALVGISTMGAEDWTEEFVFSHGAADADADANADASPQHHKNTDRDIDEGEDWDAEIKLQVGGVLPCNDVAKMLPPKSLRPSSRPPSLRLATTLSGAREPGSVDKRLAPTTQSQEEDWDQEFGIQVAIQEAQFSMTQGFKHLIKEVEVEFLQTSEDNAPLENTEFPVHSIPSKCRVVSQIVQGESNEVKILRYPKGCELFSLAFDDNRKSMMGQQLESWLKNIVRKHEVPLEAMSKQRDASWTMSVQAKERKFNSRVTQAWCELIHVLYRKKDKLSCVHVIKKFGKVLKTVCRQSRTGVRRNNSNRSRLNSTSRSMDSKSSTTRSSQEAERYKTYRHTYSILNIAAVLEGELLSGNIDLSFSLPNASDTVRSEGRSSTSKQIFTDMNKLAAGLFPEYKDSFVLLELRAASHNLPYLLARAADEHGWGIQGGRIQSTPTERLPYVICTHYIRLYSRMAESESEMISKADSADIGNISYLKVAVLTDLYFFLNGISPLTVEFSQALVECVPDVDDQQEWENEEANSDNSNSQNDQDREIDSGSENGTEVGAMEETTGQDSDILTVEFEDNFAAVTTPVSELETLDDMDFQMDSDLSGTSHLSSTGTPSLNGPPPTHTAMRQRGHSVSSNHTNASFVRRKSQKKYVQLEDILKGSDDGVREVMRIIKEDTVTYGIILTQAYLGLTEHAMLKGRAAIALGLLSSAAHDYNTAEQLHMEAVVILDRLRSHGTSEIPLVTTIGSFALEKLGDVLLRTGKYKFGVLALEAAVDCHKLQHTGDENRLYRRLCAITQEQADIARSLKYHTYMLRAAADACKKNEFVYIAEVVSKLLLEMGEYDCADRCLRVAVCLLGGVPMELVHFVDIGGDDVLPSKLSLPVLPEHVLLGGWKDQRGRRASDSSAVETGALDFHQLQLQMKLVEVLITSDRHTEASHILVKLLSRRISSQSRAPVLVLLARCYLKLRKLPACEATLDRLCTESDDAVTSLASNQGMTSNVTSTAVGLVKTLRSVEFLLYRSRCRLAMGDAVTTLHWLSIAVAVCPKGKFGLLGRLFYIQGRAYGLLCQSCHDSSSGRVEDLELESQHARSSEDSFLQAYKYYRSTDDLVHQVKCLIRITDLHISRVLADVSLRGTKLDDTLEGRGLDIVKGVDRISSIALELAGDLANPLLLLHALITFSELNYLLGRLTLAQSSWSEGQALLTLTFLQRKREETTEHPVSATSSTTSTKSVHQSHNSEGIQIVHTPLHNFPLPSIAHSPGLMLRLYSILTRLLRLAFAFRPSPVSKHTQLVAAWIHLDLEANRYRVYPQSTPLSPTADEGSSIFSAMQRLTDSDTFTADGKQEQQLFKHGTEARPTTPSEKHAPGFTPEANLVHDDLDTEHVTKTVALAPAEELCENSEATSPCPTKAFAAVQRAMALNVGSLTPDFRGVNATDSVISDMQWREKSPPRSIYISPVEVNAAGELTEIRNLNTVHSHKSNSGKNSDSQLLSAPRSMPMIPDEEFHQIQARENWLEYRQEARREMLCKACFLRLKIYTRKYVTGKIALSEYYRFNMETLQKLVQLSVSDPFIHPLVRESQYRKHSHAPSDEFLQMSTEHPNGILTSLQPFQSQPTVEQNTEFLRSRRKSEVLGRKQTVHHKRKSDGNIAIFGDASPSFQPIFNLASKPKLYPPSFRFILFMDGSLLFYCPFSGTKQIAPLHPGSKNNFSPTKNSLEEANTNDSSSMEPFKSKVSNFGNPDSPQNIRLEVDADSDQMITSNVISALEDVPLKPAEEGHVLPTDDSVTVIVDRLGYQDTVFLLNALLLEQPVLILASPGQEETLLLCATALLRLLRPLQWQHAYIPMMHFSFLDIFHSIVSSKLSFLVGTYHDVLESMLGSNADNTPDLHIGSFGLDETMQNSTLARASACKALAHVTIVDIDLGAVRPGQCLKFAALTTMSFLPTPDGDSEILDHILGQVLIKTDETKNHRLLPPIPARYRYSISQRIDMASGVTPTSQEQKIQDYKTKLKGRAVTPVVVGGRIFTDVATAYRVAEALRGGLFLTMVSLFKGLQVFTSSTNRSLTPADEPESNLSPAYDKVVDAVSPVSMSAWSDDGSCVVQEELGSGKQRSSAESVASTAAICTEAEIEAQQAIEEDESPATVVTGDISFDRQGFLKFLKNDVRPFMRELTKTVAFQVMMKEVARSSHKHAQTDLGLAYQADSFMARFMMLVQQRMKQKLRLYSTISITRKAGYLFTFFVSPQRYSDEQPLAFQHRFPYLPTDVQKSPPHQTRVKRRWCVLDAKRLTYFRSHSKRRIKSYISMDCACVRLVTSPFVIYDGSQISESVYSALVCADTVMVFRAETQAQQDQWVQLIRSRLLHPDATKRLQQLYGATSKWIPQPSLEFKAST